MEIVELLHNLRLTLTEYRYARRSYVVSKHLNAIEIAVCLVEYAIEDKRPISLDEQNWFEAVYQISYLFDGSEWEDLSTMYAGLVAEVKNQNYFR